MEVVSKMPTGFTGEYEFWQLMGINPRSVRYHGGQVDSGDWRKGRSGDASEKPTILLPKEGSSLWPVTNYALKKLGVGYEYGSKKYRIDVGDVDLFLGKPSDWRTALEYGLADAAVTGLDLVVDRLCRDNYVIPKRSVQTAAELPREKGDAMEFLRKFLEDYETEEQKLSSFDKINLSIPYTFSDAKQLKGLPYPLLRLRMGNGLVMLLGELPYSPRNDNVGCPRNYRNLSELWLDESYTNYMDDYLTGYRLVPYSGSLEGTNLDPIIDFVVTGGTAEANGRKATREILNSQAVVVFREPRQTEIRRFVEDLFSDIIVPYPSLSAV